MIHTIIPQNLTFVQAVISPNLDFPIEKPERYSAQWTTVQQQAYHLFDAGLNVFPLPRSQKSGYPWKALQYTKLNRSHSTSGLSALFAGDCNIGVMCGATSGNLFVLDCETPDSFAAHLAEVKKRDIPVWAVITARGGHLYFRCEEGEVHNIESGMMQDIELRGRHGYVLTAASLHPSGSLYDWLIRDDEQPPLVSLSQINWLKNKEGQSLQLKVTANRLNYKRVWKKVMVSPFSRLSRSTREYIAGGQFVEEGARNTQLFKAACDLAGNNYAFHEAEDLLLAPAMMSGLARHEAALTLESAYSRSRTPSKPELSPFSADEHQTKDWLRALLYASHRPWSGKSSANLRALFLALIERSREGDMGSGIFRASFRELAELARLAVNTVRRLLEMLQQESLIHSTGYDRMSGATLWYFGETVLREGLRLELMPDSSVPEHWGAYAESLFYADSSERGSIGKSGVFLYRFMTTKRAPMMPSELAARSGLSLNQVNYALAKLRRYALVHRGKQGWMADCYSDSELDEKTGAAPRGEMRRRRHRFEREIFAGNLLLRARIFAEGQTFIETLINQTRATLRSLRCQQGENSEADSISESAENNATENLFD